MQRAREAAEKCIRDQEEYADVAQPLSPEDLDKLLADLNAELGDDSKSKKGKSSQKGGRTRRGKRLSGRKTRGRRKRIRAKKGGTRVKRRLCRRRRARR